MKIKNLLIAALLLVTGVSQAQTQLSLPKDTTFRIGVLPNGLTYYIRHNNWPEHRANFYIAQKVGSIQEEESQRGLAHFLEHMCFNGTDHFKGNDLIEYCRSIGVAFGQDLNAYTSIDQTVYNIDNVPTTRQSSLDSCLLILRDWADGLTLDPKEIDKERGVIHEEWRLRTSPSSRMFERNLPKLYPNSKYGVRFPIGLMSVVDNFKPKELRDYYEKWYHPANQGIIVVGDVDVDHTEAMIKKLFGPMKNPENPAPIVEELVPDNAKPIVVIDKDKEMTEPWLSVMFKHDVFPDSLKDNLGYLVYEYLRTAAISMLNDRLSETAQAAGCPFVSASVDDGSYIFAKTKDAFNIDIRPKNMNSIPSALKQALIEVRRAGEFGFTESEYDRFKSNYLSQIEKMYSNREKLTNSYYYSECKSNFLSKDPIVPLDFYYNKSKELVPVISIDYVNNMMKDLMPKNDSNMVVLNFNTEKEGNVYPTEKQLLEAVDEAMAKNVNAYVDNAKQEPLIAKLPKAGKIKKTEENQLLGYKKLTLSNGVKVLLKKTDYKKDQVLLSGEGPGGTSLYGKADLDNMKMFNSVVGASGLGNFSSTELKKALAGKIAGAGLSMGSRKLYVAGNSTPNDVETMLQLVYLFFTKINKDQKSYDNLMSQFEISLKNRSLSADVAFSDSVNATLYDHNPIAMPMTLDGLKNVNYDRILQIAKERTSNASQMTFTIIGNYDEQKLLPLICQYLGALPTKGKIKKGTQQLFVTKGMVENIFERKMETPKANAYVIWNNESMPYTLENVTRLSMAGQILSMVYLKEIREEASAAYSCGASGAASRTEDSHRFMVIGYCPMKPEKKDLAMKIMYSAIDELTEKVDGDMLLKVKEIMLKDLDTSRKTNGYWLQAIVDYDNYKYDAVTEAKKVIESQTPDSIKAFVKEFLKSKNRITIEMLPKAEKK